jgi:tetratricopeptide (TPR) repeat protein
MALLSSYLRFATERYWFTARLAAKTLLTVAFAGGLVYLSWQATRSADESIWLMRAHKAKAQSPEQIAALQKAFSIEPQNGATARAIGEEFRLQSWQNTGDYEEQAREAMKWFKRAMELNPYDDSSVLRYGMCLDQLGQHDDAFAYFDRANQMDPNSYFNNAYMGWHYVQTGDDAAAVVWLERSRRMFSEDNPIANSYLRIARDQMSQAATNTSPLQWHASSPAQQLTLPPWDKK